MKPIIQRRSLGEICDQLTNPGVIAIIRASDSAHILEMSKALVEGGVNAVEITLTTPNALGLIRECRQSLPEDVLVGVGTVLDEEACESALDAGAEFVVTPVLRPRVISVAHWAGRPVMIGSFTPTEAQLAHDAGADFIKLFPADNLGPSYIKSIRAPLPHLRIVPTGGVDLENLKEFLDAGCPAVGIGSSLMPGKMIKERDWKALAKRAAEFVAAADTAKLEIEN
jgi:2-dehydro-3-deoxyphosphogluconate aldolase/(4S)-4-hydroxy-2-oxoglutarate aldolase